MAVVCPRCKDTFNITKEYGALIVCPWCGLGSEAEWFHGLDGEDCRLITPNPALCPHGRPGVDFPGISVQTLDVDHFVPPPPNDRLDAVMFAMRCLMEDKMGLPARLAESEPRTFRNDFMEAIIRVTEGTGLNVKAEFTMDCERVHLSINQQAQMMDMRIINNRKRMRKRVRQYRRHWAPPHWTETTGDW